MSWDDVRHPVVWWMWRQNDRLKRENDVLRSELAVAKCRENRWRRAAEVACQGNPQAERLLAFQRQSDALADADEIEDGARNAGPPRSCPGLGDA